MGKDSVGVGLGEMYPPHTGHSIGSVPHITTHHSSQIDHLCSHSNGPDTLLVDH